MSIAWLLYSLGLVLTIGAATETVVRGAAAVVVLVLGLATFAAGIVVEERRT